MGGGGMNKCWELWKSILFVQSQMLEKNRSISNESAVLFPSHWNIMPAHKWVLKWSWVLCWRCCRWTSALGSRGAGSLCSQKNTAMTQKCKLEYSPCWEGPGQQGWWRAGSSRRSVKQTKFERRGSLWRGWEKTAIMAVSKIINKPSIFCERNGHSWASA